jgi:1-aminocyclopropane-1-carboxylate deaminase/D-cysteine desulfhydrase-like pyridoxal-dependent ACC family enzyme
MHDAGTERARAKSILDVSSPLGRSRARSRTINVRCLQRTFPQISWAMAESTRGPDANALRRLADIPTAHLLRAPTPLEEMPRLGDALGGGPRLFVKRDDAIPFGFGGNKVRKLELFVVDARAAGADTLVTLGGVQSNHARATAAIAAKFGMRCVIIANGKPPERPTANALLDRLLGADVEYIESREQRAPALAAALERLKGEGRSPFAIPLGASTPLGALGFVRAIGELLEQMDPPTVIIHASSSGGTQAGLVAGCALHGLATRVIGVSADDPSAEISAKVRDIVHGIGDMLGTDGGALVSALPIVVDDTQVGDGYGIPSDASREAQSLAARTEALFVDHTYTAKALAALISRVRAGAMRDAETIVFWHTGGQVGLFA